MKKLKTYDLTMAIARFGRTEPVSDLAIKARRLCEMCGGPVYIDSKYCGTKCRQNAWNKQREAG